MIAADVWGRREAKYEFLWAATLPTNAGGFAPSPPSYSFVERNETNKAAYENGVRIAELFPVFSVGVVMGRDNIVSAIDRDTLEANIEALRRLPDSEIRARFKLKEEDARDWTVSTAKAMPKGQTDRPFIQ